MGREHRNIKSIYREYEDWEIRSLECHEPWGNSSRKTSIKLGMFMYVTRKYHAWLHNTHEGRLKNKEYQEEIKIKCIEVHEMPEEDFNEIFIRGNSLIRDKYI